MRSFKRVIAAIFAACLLTAGLLTAEAAEPGVLRKAGANDFANGSTGETVILAAEKSETKSAKKAGKSNSAEKGKENTGKKTGEKAQKNTAAKVEKTSNAKPAENAAKKGKPSNTKPAEKATKTDLPSKAKPVEKATKTDLPSEVKETAQSAIEKAKNSALNALSGRLSRTRDCVYVYRDYGLTENHFTQKSKIYASDDSLVKDMDENCEKKPYSGTTCIRCEQKGSRKDQGGWMFLNGYLKKWDETPKPNDGKKGGAGLDLSGADALRFYARGKKGGEVVEFFTCGFGYDPKNIKTTDNPDSSTKKSTGQVILTKDWKEYVIPLNGADLSYIVCGFGYEVSGAANAKKDIVFYLDEIRFTGEIKSAKTAPVLLRSSDADDRKLKNAAFTEDNALAALAFLSAGKKEEAKEILHAFVYAVQNDRAYDSEGSGNDPRRVRNAYAAGDISAFPGWNSGTRLPGWYDEDGKWQEDRHQVGSSTASNSYVALALVQYYDLYGDESYLQTACSLMDWVKKKCFDHSLGYTRGFDGWKESDTLDVYPLTTRNTKDNLIAYAAFSRLYEATAEEKYLEASQYAIRFIENMYNEGRGRFISETLEDGYTPDPRSIVLLDVQSLGALAMWDSFEPYLKTLETIESMKVKKGGYPYNRNNKNGGWWAEGTAFTALMYRVLGKEDKYEEAMKSLVGIQKENGLFPAATVKKLYTGLNLDDGSTLSFTKDTHIAPSAWFIMAANGYNPFAPHGTKEAGK